MEKHPMTPQGYDRLRDELRRLKHDDRPRVIVAIATAREHGDISENAEYHAAKDQQGMIEARIKELEAKVSRAEVIDPKQVSSDRIQFGAEVTVIDEETEKVATYRIVGADEGDIQSGFLSYTAPLARALLGKTVGQSVEISTPSGVRSYEITKVRYG
ncbi:MAG: transcription elongation factor GreA [Alphaproteobacteria bacterium]|nr:transcription elongation factor GreA [Alphaproteobacteria bacterium]